MTLSVGNESHELDRSQVRKLRDQLTAVLSERRAFVHTAGERREDGAYVVERRGASSSGHRKVFDSFEAARAAFADLPDEFTAEDVRTAGVTGGRRHMLVWHFAEHPDFDCELVSRQPLTVRKGSRGRTDSSSATEEVSAD